VRCLGLLPAWDAEKSELLAAWTKLLDERGVRVSTRETVEDVQREPMASRSRAHARAIVPPLSPPPTTSTARPAWRRIVEQRGRRGQLLAGHAETARRAARRVAGTTAAAR